MPSYQPIVNPQSLGQMNQVPVDLTLDAQRWMQQGQSADQAGLADMVAGYQHDQAMRPLQQQHLDIANQQGLAQLPGMKAQSELTQQQSKMGAATLDAGIKSKLNDFALKITDDHLKQIAQHGQELMYSNDPKERMEGQQIMAATQHMFEKRQEHFMKQEEEHIKGKYSVDVANILANSRMTAAQTRANGVSKSEAELVGKMPFDRQVGYWNAKAREAISSGDTAAAQDYSNEADKAYAAFQQGKTLGAGAAQAGKPNIGAVAGIPTNPAPPVAPFGPGKAPVNVAAPQPAIEHLRKNPKLAEAFDAKYGQGAAAKVLGK